MLNKFLDGQSLDISFRVCDSEPATSGNVRINAFDAEESLEGRKHARDILAAV